MKGPSDFFWIQIQTFVIMIYVPWLTTRIKYVDMPFALDWACKKDILQKRMIKNKKE